MAKMSRGVKMKNKKKILLVSGIGIVIMAIAIGVAIAVSRPGTMKNSRQAASGQATSTTQSDSGTHGKKASREQAESKGKKNDLKSPDQKNTTGADSKAKAAKKLRIEKQHPRARQNTQICSCCTKHDTQRRYKHGNYISLPMPKIILNRKKRKYKNRNWTEQERCSRKGNKSSCFSLIHITA